MTINLDELERLGKEATPGLWDTYADLGATHILITTEGGQFWLGAFEKKPSPINNAAFIIAARNNWDELLRLARIGQEASE